MKTVYDALNDVRVDAQDYDVRPLSESEKNAMKRNFRRDSGTRRPSHIARWSVVAACLVCVIGFSQTAFAKAALSDILQSIDLGHNIVVQFDPSREPKKPDLSGYYDKDGKPLTGVNPNGTTDLYDAKGNKVGTIGNTPADTDMDTEPNVLVEKDLNKAVAQLSFQPLLPKELPKGYTFEKARLYKGEDDKVSDYVDLIYKNGSRQIFMQERRVTKETTYTAGTDDKVQKTTINGHTAALYGHSIDWEAGGVSIGISAGGISTDELTKLAESMK